MQFSVEKFPIKPQNIKIETNKFKLVQYGVLYVQKKNNVFCFTVDGV
jgi:hypothetical protein